MQTQPRGVCLIIDCVGNDGGESLKSVSLSWQIDLTCGLFQPDKGSFDCHVLDLSPKACGGSFKVDWSVCYSHRPA